MKLFKLFLGLSTIFISCKSSSYLSTKQVLKVNQINYGAKDSASLKIGDHTLHLFDNGAASYQLVGNTINLTFHKADTVHKTIVVYTYLNKSIERKTLRVEKDSIDKSSKVAILAIKAQVKESNNLVKLKKLTFMEKVILILKQLKWLFIILLIADISYHIYHKWRH